MNNQKNNNNNKFVVTVIKLNLNSNIIALIAITIKVKLIQKIKIKKKIIKMKLDKLNTNQKALIFKKMIRMLLKMQVLCHIFLKVLKFMNKNSV